MSNFSVLASMGINPVALITGQSQSSSFDFSILYKGAGSTTSGQVYSSGNASLALKNAEEKESQQLAQTANQPDIQRDLEHYEKVLARAETLDDILDDPIARQVLMRAEGLGDQVNYVGMAKRAMASDPSDPDSAAAKLSSVNGAWLAFARKYDIANNGLDRLRPNNDGLKGDWRVTLQRNGESLEANLAVTQVKGAWQATIDGEPVAVEVKNDTLAVVLAYEDSAGGLHTSRLTGKVSSAGLSLVQADDGKTVGSSTATPYYQSAITEVRTNYIAEKRLDMLDSQLPGLGSAVLFKTVAASLDTPLKILGSAIGREIVTVALNIPKQIAVQSVEAQMKAVSERMDAKMLSDPHFVDRLVQRYLINLNGGASGVTA